MLKSKWYGIKTKVATFLITVLKIQKVSKIDFLAFDFGKLAYIIMSESNQMFSMSRASKEVAASFL